MEGPRTAWLPGGRLHLNHGPIDLIIEAWGEADEVRLAYRQAIRRFTTILTELVAELPGLRGPASSLAPFAGSIARRMAAAVAPFAAEAFITPMAAVAGAVADEILQAMKAGRRLDRAYVNDGGDIAIHLSEGRSITAAIAGAGRGFADRVEIGHADPVRGIATSGWRGRSHSLGIADAVTVLARTAAEADAAATLIANAVDLPDHPAVRREPAVALAPDSDLGQRLVTTAVGALSAADVGEALEAGLRMAEQFRRRGLIEAAALFLCGDRRLTGRPPANAKPSIPAPRTAIHA